MYQARNAVGIPYQKFCINSATNHNLCLIWELPPKNTVNKKLRKSSQPWFWQRNSLYWIIWIQSFESCRCLSFVLYLQRPGDIVPDFHSLTKDDNSLLTNQKMGKNRCRSTGWSHTARRPGRGWWNTLLLFLCGCEVKDECWRWLLAAARSVCVTWRVSPHVGGACCLARGAPSAMNDRAAPSSSPLRTNNSTHHQN